MDDPKRATELKQFIEDIGILSERWGLPRVAGRILGWLMICDPPFQSASQITEEIGTSMGSVSTMSRLLVHSGLVEKVGIPRERRTYFRLTSDFMFALVQVEIESLRVLRGLAERGLEKLTGKNAGQRQRLQSIYDVWSFLDREFSILMEGYQLELHNDDGTYGN